MAKNKKVDLKLDQNTEDKISNISKSIEITDDIKNQIIDEISRFNLILLNSERIRMKALQTKCTRDYKVLNLSEILRAGIGALERLSEQQLIEVVENVKQL